MNYQQIQASAEKMLSRMGSSIRLSYVKNEDINPATGVVTSAGRTVNITTDGVMLRYKNMEINGETVLASDMKLIIPNISTKPEVNWSVLANTQTWRVMNVTEINPAGTNCIYILQLRK